MSNPSTRCIVDGCIKNKFSNASQQMCHTHYRRTKTYGSPDGVRPKTYCSIDGCTNPHEAKGLCSNHYLKSRRHNQQDDSRLECSVENCTYKVHAKTLCERHHRKTLTYSLSVEQVATLPTECQICHGTSDLCIDHDHACCSGRNSCGKCIRGVICRRCNKVLGSVGDDVDLLQKMIEYLNS